MQPPSARRWMLVCRGLEVPVDFPVREWQETGFRFHAVRNRTLTSAVVCHWTGAENSPGAVYATMSSTNAFKPLPLSVHFVVDAGGTVYQMADTEMRAAHCRAQDMNSKSVGIEFINRGTARHLPARGTLRRPVTAIIHGRTTVYDEMTEPQLRNGVKLVRTLCNLYGLPLKVPLDSTGDVFSSVVPEAELESFAGVIGHFHAEENKVDPGLGLLRAIRDAGKAQSGSGPSSTRTPS